MSEQLTVLWLATVALLSTFGGLVASVPRYRNGESSFTGIIAYAFALMFWLLYTANSLNYFVATGGETVTQSSDMLAVAGAIGAVIALILLFDAALRTIDIR